MCRGPLREYTPHPFRASAKARGFLALGMAFLLFAFAACTGSQEGGQPDAERGATIYSENCQVCHGDATTGNRAIPNAPTHGPQGHTWHHADGQLVQIIFGQLDFPGKTMPSFEGKLTEGEVRDVLGYIKSGWPAEMRQSQAEASENWRRSNQ